MQNALIPHVQEFCHITDHAYRLGWDERNGGNLSLRIDDPAVIAAYAHAAVLRTLTLDFHAPSLAGQLFLVTGTGRYFRNVSRAPAANMGLIQIAADGKSFDILWGFEKNGRPTSELPAHLMSHVVRLETDPQTHVVLHCHPIHLLCMTRVHTLDEREFTRTLWRTITECMVVFPDGVGVLPWMICGTPEIGEATAEKMQSFRLVVWAQHGIFGAGQDLDEVFGLIETVEKAAEIYLKTAYLPTLQSITDMELAQIAQTFGLTPRAGFLDG